MPVSLRNPETFDVISGTIGPQPLKNLAAISRVLSQIANGEVFGDDQPLLQPVNSFVAESIVLFSEWFFEGEKMSWIPFFWKVAIR